MSDDHETELMREARAYVNSSDAFQVQENDFEAAIKTWESSVNWDRVLQGPKIDVRGPFVALTALAGRIKDDCVLDFPAYMAEVQNDIDAQPRLNDMKKLAAKVHEAIGTTNTSIIQLADNIKDEKNLVSDRVPLVTKEINKLDELISKLATEASSRQAVLAKLAADLQQTAKDISAEKKVLKDKKAEEKREKDKHNDWKMRWDIIGNAIFKRKQTYKRTIESIHTARDSAQRQLDTFEGNEKTQKAQDATYSKLLADLYTVRAQLTTRHSVLGVAAKSLTVSQTQLTNTSARWSTLEGNVGKLATSLKEVTDDAEDTYIPTRKWVAEDVVAAVNVGTVFLQFEGVEKELRETLDTIDRAMEGVVKTESDKIKVIVVKVRERVDQIVKVEIPAQGGELQWFPRPADLGAREDEEVYNVPGVEFDDSDDEEM